MASVLAWLDHSEPQRRRMLEIIDLFRERSTQDDLGVATVWMALSDLLFPGTSTLLTRARYFLFVPWVYLDLETRRIPSAKVAARARGREVWVSAALLEGGETEGVIGREAGARLKRLPSEQYWGGLGRWRIRLFEGSQHRYHMSLDGFYRSATSDQGEERMLGGRLANWHPGIPEAPDDLYQQTTFDLSREEADYLSERILLSAPGTLLAYLVTKGLTTDVVFPWEHPQLGDLPEDLSGQVLHARNLSESLFVASALYNLMLAEAVGNDEWVEEYRQMYTEARQTVEARLGEQRSWDRAGFWMTVLRANPRVPTGTRSFVDRFLDLALTDSPDLQAQRELIRHRERVMKGRLARLSNPDALHRWGGASGAFRLDFRWRNVQTIVNDILEGKSS